MICPICGEFVVRQENHCKKVQDRTIVIATIYVCKRGHKFTKKGRKWKLIR